MISVGVVETLDDRAIGPVVAGAGVGKGLKRVDHRLQIVDLAPKPIDLQRCEGDGQRADRSASHRCCDERGHARGRATPKFPPLKSQGHARGE